MKKVIDWANKQVVRIVDFLRRRKQNYRLTFLSPVGLEVLMDLADFCRAGETCFHPDPRQHAVLEGRREVWLRIQHHLHLTDEQLYSIYTGNPRKDVMADVV